MIIVGLTGGIGSGKTTVAKLFVDLGISVYFADDEAKKIMQTSNSLKSKICATFGDEAYLNNTLNRSYLAKLVFTDKANLNRLNALVHPEVKQHFNKWLKLQNGHYVVYENAILFETDTASQFDFIITVTASLETRINRIINRDGVDKQMVLDRINNQWEDVKKNKLSNAIIENNGKINLKDKVKELHQRILML